MLHVKNPGPVEVQRHLYYILQTTFTRTHNVAPNPIYTVRNRPNCTPYVAK
jgi:hypothetical protein